VTTRGFTALDIGCNAHQVERTYRDVRQDGADHYFTLFQASGQSAIIHNDQAVRLAVGDVALVDAARPVTYCADNGTEPWNTVSLSLPRQSLVSYLGFEPQGGLYRPAGTPAGRLLFDLIRTSGDGDEGDLNRLLRCGNKSIMLLAASQLGEGLMINKAKLALICRSSGASPALARSFDGHHSIGREIRARHAGAHALTGMDSMHMPRSPQSDVDSNSPASTGGGSLGYNQNLYNH